MKKEGWKEGDLLEGIRGRGQDFPKGRGLGWNVTLLWMMEWLDLGYTVYLLA